MPLAFIHPGIASVPYMPAAVIIPMIPLSGAPIAASSLEFTDVKLRRPLPGAAGPADGPPGGPYIGVGGRMPDPCFDILVLGIIQGVYMRARPVPSVKQFLFVE